MTEKQLGTVVDEDIHESIKAEAERQDCSMREIIEESICINLGLDDVSSIESLRSHINRLEDEIADLEKRRDEIDNEIENKKSRLEDHRDALEMKLNEQDSISELVDDILDDLVANPKKTVDAHMDDLRSMTNRSTDIGTIDDAKDRVWDIAMEDNRDVDPSQIPSVSGSNDTSVSDSPTTPVAADGLGRDDSDPDFNLDYTNDSDEIDDSDDDDDDDDDPKLMTDGGINKEKSKEKKLKKLWSDYLDTYSDEIDEIASECPIDPDTDPKPIELPIDWTDVYQFNSDFAFDILKAPESFQDTLNKVISEYDTPAPVHLDHVEPRIFNLGESYTKYVNQISTQDVGSFREIKGQIQNTSGEKAAVVEGCYECQRCGTRNYMPQPLGSDDEEPHECEGCERQGPFQIDFDKSKLRDMEVVRITEPPERTNGSGGQTVDVILDGPVVGNVEPGDRVSISGNITINEDIGDHGQRDYLVEGRAVTHLESSYDTIELTDEKIDEIERLADEYGLDIITKSIAPDHIGDEIVIESIALQLFGAPHGETADGGRTRGDIHILLPGDPSMGKSELLNAAEEISPRSASVSGKGASAAGLTAAALPADRGDGMRLEAGAMVLGSGGLAAIDELDKIPDEVASSLHGAMGSQQIVDIDKAGFNTSLPSRTAVLAAANPKHGRYDQYEPVADQIDISSPMMSRFDLIWPMTDDIDDKSSEEKKAEQIIDSFAEATERSAGRVDDDDDEILDQDLIRHWIAHARDINPRLPEECRSILAGFYSELRAKSQGDDAPIQITTRKLQSLIRLSQASARARLSDVVGFKDVNIAIKLVKEMMEDLGIDEDFDADVVETGKSKTQRKRIRQITNKIEELEEDGEDGAPHHKVIDELCDDIDRDNIESEIEKLNRSGKIHDPKRVPEDDLEGSNWRTSSS